MEKYVLKNLSHLSLAKYAEKLPASSCIMVEEVAKAVERSSEGQWKGVEGKLQIIKMKSTRAGKIILGRSTILKELIRLVLFFKQTTLDTKWLQLQREMR